MWRVVELNMFYATRSRCKCQPGLGRPHGATVVHHVPAILCHCWALRSPILTLAMFDARRPVPHRGSTAHKSTNWIGTKVVVEGFGAENSPPTMGQSWGRDSGNRGVDRARQNNGSTLGAEKDQTTQEWPGLLPLTSELCSPKVPKRQSQRRAKPHSVDRSPGSSGHQSQKRITRHNHQKENYPRAFPHVNA